VSKDPDAAKDVEFHNLLSAAEDLKTSNSKIKAIEAIKEGYGEGSFVVIKTLKRITREYSS